MLQFTIDRKRDPNRVQLHRLLQAQLTCERMGVARSLFAHLLAITGMVLWLEVIWPGLLESEIRFFVLILFGSLLFLALRVGVEEVIWRVRLKRCLKANEGVKLEDAHRLEQTDPSH